jgi:ribonuclease PH
MRAKNKLRAIEITRNYTKYAPGSVLISYGDTKVLCTASIEERVPPFLRDAKQGWLTAEYSLLPGSTSSRVRRAASAGKISGRASEIQRLIGRSLRAILDFKLLGERTIYIDTDVIQADGGTRTASITGGMVALIDAVNHLLKEGKIQKNPIRELLGAVSVGVVKGQSVLDLDYSMDLGADVDMNIVMTESQKFVEIQGTAENALFTSTQLQEMLDLGQKGISEIIEKIKSIYEPA